MLIQEFQKFLLLLVLIGNSFLGFGQNFKIQGENIYDSIQNTIFLRKTDSVWLVFSKETPIYTWKPSYSDYQNFPPNTYLWDESTLTKICYHTQYLTTAKRLSLADFSLGTHYLSFEKLENAICTLFPLQVFNKKIIQICIRQDDSYLGFLTEQIGVPFLLPPFQISPKIHQTDYRTGVDCAELAIYGRRRQGFNIPYLGPIGIVQFLKPMPESQLCSGTILHFGSQVSILYEDMPPYHQLNAKDKIIQAYHDFVKIVSYQDSGFYHQKPKFYEWKSIKR